MDELKRLEEELLHKAAEAEGGFVTISDRDALRLHMLIVAVRKMMAEVDRGEGRKG